MGNVMAASKNDPKMVIPESLLTAPAPAPTTVQSPSAGSSEKTNLVNPGTVEELHKKTKDVMAMTFEGAKVMLNKGLSNHFQVSHSINLTSTQPSGYRFSASYIGENQTSAGEVYPVLHGEIDPSGNLNTNIMHIFHPKLKFKFASQIQDNKLTVAQMSTDYRGDDFSAALTIGNPNLLNNSGVIVGHYLQSVTENLALGGELAYQYGQNVPGGQIAVMSALAKYTNGDSTWSGSIGAGGVHVCYYQKASEQLQIGVEMETSLRMAESVATIGYQVDLPKADLVFRGSFDSNWTVSGCLEKRLQPLPFSFMLCGRLNHTKNQFRLGCGFVIG